MRKCIKRLIICGILAACCWCFQLLKDREQLNNGLIRFHVVANSDNREDQAIKERVRDAVLAALEKDLQKIADVSTAKQYLQEQIPKIRSIAERTLQEAGFAEPVRVSLCREAFDVRHYDTFSLPSGIYESLRIVIGDGLGHNWWCVSFPTLCMPATTSGFEDTAAGAGFSQPLTRTLADRETYEIRFFLLDQLGKLENYFHQE